MALTSTEGAMDSVRLEIPAVFVPLFRIGVLTELEFDGDWVKSQAEGARRWIEGDGERRRDPKPDSDPFEQLNGPTRELGHDTEVLRQLGTGEVEKPITVTGDPSALKHSLEGTARYFCKDLQQAELAAGEEDGGDGEVRARATVIGWATEEAQRLWRDFVFPELDRRKQEQIASEISEDAEAVAV